VPAPRGAALLRQLADSSKALYTVISDFRIFVRLWGVLGLYTWARDYLLRAATSTALPQDGNTGTGTSPSTSTKTKTRKQKTIHAITGAQIASLLAFQVLENGAYLSSKGVLTSASWSGARGKAREAKWWVWSCRFWAAYVVLEGVRLGAVWKFDSEGDGEKEKEKEGKIAKREADRVWWRDVVSNAAYFPMTLHWSVEQGLLSDVGVGLCGVFAGGANLVDAWRSTA
jgi:hypothetical protein